MPLISLQDVDYSIGGPLLLEKASLTIEAGERIALVGRNGTGKSTLLRLIAGELRPDDGQIHRQEGIHVTRLEQEVPCDAIGSVFDVVAAGLGDLGRWLAEFHHLSHADHLDPKALAAVQNEIDGVDGWALDRRVNEVLSRLELNGESVFDTLSGGMKRRVLLARALVVAPDLLLLDEPTNHLDVEAIEWLESFLKSWGGSVMFVTHDRRFLRALATRIVDIDRGRVSSWLGDWENYLRRRGEALHAEAQERARFDKLLAQEEIWIRQGIKARRTRDEGRVRRLQAMRRERGGRRELIGNVRMEAVQGEQAGRKVIEARGIRFAYANQVLVENFSTTIMRGDKVGLIGPNGSGKTTLLRLLLGELPSQQGEIRLGTNLRIAYFDQYRATLREDWNALENVAEGRDFLEINGRRKHVLAYLQDFLFTPERARAPITRLSGGERNRLLLARLFAQPSNLLVMDEPTNDLDTETLELLEELLGDYSGTLLLVSHDRDFLDNVITSSLVMEGGGRVGEYIGGYDDWLRQRPEQAPMLDKRTNDVKSIRIGKRPENVKDGTGRCKLSYKDARELEQLPERIESIEVRIASLTEQMSDPKFYQKNGTEMAACAETLASLQRDLDLAYARWAELDG